MIIDGNKIAEDVLFSLKRKITELGKRITLVVFVVGRNPVIEKFVALKRKKAQEVGIDVEIVYFPDDVKTDVLRKSIQKSAQDKNVSGIVVQLPLPKSIEADAVLRSIPIAKDVDVLSHESIEALKTGRISLLPPVVGAIVEILKRESVSVKDKNVVVIGKGALVGMPAALWFKKQGARVTVVDKKTKNLSAITKKADIIVSGAGVVSLITPDMLKKGVVLFDAGTSESEGKVAGDADPRCAGTCRIFTPVPSGIGPITVAVLLRNVVERAFQQL